MINRWDETWHRLREWTNGQGPSERLATQILLDDGYSSLDPTHPLGGRDGAKDATCNKNGQRWIMAVYFPRGQKRFVTTRRKFLGDAAGVEKNAAIGIAFVTNQELSLGERQALRLAAADAQVDLFHLERITGILDKPAMAAIRKQFLQIDYSEDALSKVYDLVLPKTINIVEIADGMLRSSGRFVGREVDLETIDLIAVEQFCQAVSPYGEAPIVVGVNPQQGLQYGTWLTYLRHWRNTSHSLLEDIRPFFSFMEPEHVLLLAQVEQCSYFNQLDLLRGLPINNQDLSCLAPAMWDYLQLVRALRKYACQKEALPGRRPC